MTIVTATIILTPGPGQLRIACGLPSGTYGFRPQTQRDGRTWVDSNVNLWRDGTLTLDPGSVSMRLVFTDGTISQTVKTTVPAPTPPPPPPASTFLKGVTFNADILVADPQTVTKQIAGLGVQWARVDLSWADVESQQGVYDWSGFTKAATAAKLNGLTLLPVLGYAPKWTTPANVSGYAAFVAAAVKACGPGTPLDCQWFELWNEPTEAYSWGSTADPTAYAKLVQAAATAAKQASPTVKLTVYAVYDDSPQVNGPTQWRLSWIDGMFAAVPNLGSLVDAVAVHPYSGDPGLPLADPVNGWKDASGEWAFARVDQIRRLFLEHGADLPVLVTELGWSTFTVTPALQAVYYHNLLAAVTARPWIRGLFPYTLREWRSHTGEPDDQSQFGLLSFPDWAAKPAYGALAQTFGGLK